MTCFSSEYSSIQLEEGVGEEGDDDDNDEDEEDDNDEGACNVGVLKHDKDESAGVDELGRSVSLPAVAVAVIVPKSWSGYHSASW